MPLVPFSLHAAMLPPLQMLSRTKPAAGPGSPMVAKDKQKQKKKIPKMDDFLNARDYTGAITLLEVRDYSGSNSVAGGKRLSGCDTTARSYDKIMGLF